ncbi:unnamed protein product [Coffea canephora]|uniref:Uncharacterized protein n=1 Tax=Coffea canephora TaxID=49390 RepID=A0A068U6Q6_COFCA|nr:unnamed protein product [Coffea canephora]
MGVSTKERGVLKLVHPGRHVEIHREPITAAEILSKYPRHCIARPDVFKFPYIVVRPESLLLPGKVFYLVPNRTLYNLLKARAQQSQQPSLRENQYKENHHHVSHGSRITPPKCWGGITATRQQHDRGPHRRLPTMLHYRKKSHDQDSEGYRRDRPYAKAWTEISDKIRKVPYRSSKVKHDQGYCRRLPTVFNDRTKSHDQDSEDYHSDTSYIDARTEITDNIRKASNRSYKASPPNSSVDSCRPFHSKGCDYHGHDNVAPTLSIVRRYNVTSTVPTVRNGVMQTRSLEDHAKLESCFKKQDSERKFLNLKVTFASPIVIPGSPSGSTSPKQTLWPCNQYN